MRIPVCLAYQVSAIIGCVLLSIGTIFAQTAAEDFEDGAISPFSLEISPGNIAEIITPVGFAARAGSKVHHLKWFADNYNGNRSGRGVEGTSGSLAKITGEGWYGFSFYAPESFPVPGKQIVIGQIICWHNSLPETNVTITLGVKTDGKLMLEGAYGVGDGGKTVTVNSVLVPRITKGSWHDVVIYCKFSRNNTGSLRAWFDGAPESTPTVSYTGINLGNGAWTDDTTMTHGGYIKWGQYCWDYANYTAGESREIYYDEITYQVGNPAGAFNLVKPAGYGSGYAVPQGGSIVAAEDFNLSTTGSQPAGFTVTSGAGTSAAVVEVPSAADKSLQLSDASTMAHVEAVKQFAVQTGRFTTSWSFKQSGADDGHRMALLSGNLPLIEFLTINGNLVYRDINSTNHILQAVPANSWYDVAVDVDLTTLKADVYVGGLRKLTQVYFRNDVTTADRIQFGTGDATSTHDLFIDKVLIRQAPPAFVDAFDSATTGSFPAGWARTNPSGEDPSVREVPSVTDKSLRFDDSIANGTSEAYTTFVPLACDFAASWSFKQTGTTDGHRMALQGGDQAAVELLTTASGNLVYRRPYGVPLTLQALSLNTLYTVKVVVRPATRQADIYVNNVLKLANQALLNNVTAVDRLVFSSADLTPAVRLYINDITVDVNSVPPPAPMPANIPRVPVVLKLDDLTTSGNVPATWRRVTDFLNFRNIKMSAGVIAKSLEVGNSSYINYIKDLKAAGMVEFWFHGYDHIGPEFGADYDYTVQKNHFMNSQSLAVSKLGFSFAAFGAPENVFTQTTVQVMSEDPEMKVWLYGDLARPAGKIVLDRVNGVNIEDPTFVPNSEKFINGYLSNYANRQFYVIQGHPSNWSDARWVEFVRLIDFLATNNVPIMTPSEFAASLGPDAAPSITTQPVGLSVAVGGSATFSVAATGTPTPTYQWFKGAAPIQGAENMSYTISQTALADAASYSVVVSNRVQSIASDTVTLTLTDPPVVVTQLTWATSAAGIWNTTAQSAWNPGPVAWNNANHDAAIFNGSAGYTITLGTPISVNGMEINTTTGNFLLQSSVLTLSGGPASTVKVTDVNALATISSAITGNSGLTKTGSGGLQLSSASNNYTGTTTMSGGSLRLGVNNALSLASGLVMTSGTLEMQGNHQSITALSGSANTTIRNRSSGSSIFTISGTSATTYAGALNDAGMGRTLGVKIAGNNALQTLSSADSSYSGTTTVSAGTLIAGASSLAAKIESNTPVTANFTTDLIALVGNPLKDGDLVIFSGTLMPGGVTTGQPGTRYYVVDSTANTFKISTTSGGAALDIISNGANVAVSHYVPGAFGIGNSAIILGDIETTANQSSASLLTGGAFTIGRAITIANQATGGIYTIGGNTSDTSTFSGLIASSMNLTVSQASGGTLNITGGITGAGTGIKTLRFNNTGMVNVSSTGISDGPTGSVAVEQSGVGTTTFSTANTYSGDTTVSAGTLAVNGSSLADSGNLILSGGTVNLSGAETVKSLFFGVVPQAAGVYSATGAGGTIGSTNFSGDGTLIVISGPAQNDPYATWINSAIFNTPHLSDSDKFPGADPDADGLPNLIEFATNGNPIDGSDKGKIAFTIQDLTAPAGNELNLVVAVLKGASFGGGATATVGGISYTVEGSLDLAFPLSAVSSMGPSDTPPAGSGLPSLAGSGWEYHCFKLNASEGLAGRGFLRLKVTRP